MKREKAFICSKSEKDFKLISIILLIICFAVISDSVICLISQVSQDGTVKIVGYSLDRVLLSVSLISLLALVFVFLRIIQRVRSELRIQEAQYRLLQSMSSVIAAEYDKESDKMTLAYYDRGGVAEKRAIRNFFFGKGFYDFVREDFREFFETTFHNLLAAPAKNTSEYPMKITGDEIRWYRFICQSLPNERGNVTGIVGSVVDVDDLVTARDSAREEASIDAMTGLLGKTAFAARASERMLNKNAAPATLLMIDLDNFKEINDTKGHLEGDRMLFCIAGLLQRVFSADDLIGRFGGDEFVVFMQGISKENTEKKLMHFRRRLAELWEGGAAKTTCSIGAFSQGNTRMIFDELLQNADEAMYIAKKSGKNNFVMMDGRSVK
ncbi:MAG: GGDEF domain-containing protein [Clostridia bacterium]|nr:GGDEF domain-containing protein [Clostridia bacterium]